MEKVSDTLQEGMIQFLSSIVSILGAFLMMLFISPLLTLIAFGTIFASLLVAALISQKTQRSFSANQEALSRLNGSIEEAFTGNTVIKAFNLEDQK